MESFDIIIIGGGPAGLAAAVAAKEEGCNSILIIERDKELGGILNQCIHNGFGLHTFREELTGPEYAERYIERVKELNIEYKLNTMVIDINSKKQVTAMNKTEGHFTIQAKAIVLAMGCRERARGALGIPGYRPAGIYSAGTAQRLVNIEGLMPGKEVVILGSGDIGLIMARRMTLEGATVKLVAELMPYSGGLKRNIVQCLDDYQIPLRLSQGTEEYFSCDTLLLSVGLIPENELSQGLGINIEKITSGPIVNDQLETSEEGIFACGNVLHVHDLVDFVSEEASLAGRNAARYVIVSAEMRESLAKINLIELISGKGVRYTVPKYINPIKMDEVVTVRFRVDKVYREGSIRVTFDNNEVWKRRKKIMAPGEMEEVKIKRQDVMSESKLQNITIEIIE
ncbi:MAG: Thioredoxin reductase [Clostridiales bacterium]|nr:Thioredoxin reductase [Clostridiales bacterium]